MKLVSSLNKKFGLDAQEGVEREDLYSEGIHALCNAAAHYDKSRGRFGVYLYTCIKNALIAYAKEASKYRQAKYVIMTVYEDNLVAEDPSVEYALKETIHDVAEFTKKRTEPKRGKSNRFTGFDFELMLTYVSDGWKWTEIADFMGVSPALVYDAMVEVRKLTEMASEFNEVMFGREDLFGS